MALGVYLANGRAGHLVLLAMVMSVVSNCLILTFLGVSTLVLPAIGQRRTWRISRAPSE